MAYRVISVQPTGNVAAITPLVNGEPEESRKSAITAPLGARATLTPVLAARTMERRSSIQRNAALRQCCSLAQERLNHPSLVTFTINWGSCRTKRRTQLPHHILKADQRNNAHRRGASGADRYGNGAGGTPGRIIQAHGCSGGSLKGFFQKRECFPHRDIFTEGNQHGLGVRTGCGIIPSKTVRQL